jgi:PAS domain S-box-containing protein
LKLDCQDELIALFETLVNVMFCIKLVDGTYAEVNTAFVRRTGRRSKREVVGHTAGELFHPDLADRYEQQDQEVFRTGEPLRDELELIRRPDGDLGWYLTTKIPITDRDDPAVVVGLVSVSRDLQTPTTESIALESLQHVVTHVREHLAETVRVGDLAAVAGCTPDQLDRRIRKVFGVTAKQYVLRVRVDRAAELLADTTIPLATVAASVGFYDQSDFTRRFARLTGQTPAQFRLAAGGTA